MKCIIYFDQGNLIYVLILAFGGNLIASDQDPTFVHKNWSCRWFCKVAKAIFGVIICERIFLGVPLTIGLIVCIDIIKFGLVSFIGTVLCILNFFFGFGDGLEMHGHIISAHVFELLCIWTKQVVIASCIFPWNIGSLEIIVADAHFDVFSFQSSFQLSNEKLTKSMGEYKSCPSLEY